MIDWQRIWHDDDVRRFSPTRAILFLLSWPYRLIVFVRNGLYDRHFFKSVKLSRPVLSVGNLTVGGTGKTPCVILVAKILKRHGYRPAVISRGYGGKASNPVNVVSDGKTLLLDARSAGDEPLLIARSLPGIPVITGAKRHLPAQAAIDRFGADVLICDDAFQHRGLYRDVDIVLLDGQKPLGNGHLLPRGELREPATSLRRAGCLILTRMDPTHPRDERVMKIARTSNIPLYSAVHRFSEWVKADGFSAPPGDIRNKKICAFCGIAKPASFSKMLIDAQAKIISFNPFPDHHVFSKYDLEELLEKFNISRADYLVTTEKDAMRLAAYPDFLKKVCVLRMDMEIIPSESFENFIVEWLAALAARGQI